MNSVRNEHHADVLLITIDRPARRNAMDFPTSHAVTATADLLDEDPALGAGIISGSGGRFCSGTYLKAFVEEGPPLRPRRGGLCGITERRSAKPLVAVWESFALGGGAELALACDLLTAGISTTFTFPEVRRGLMTDGDCIVRLSQAIPPRVPLGLLLTEDPTTEEGAHRYDLVYGVVRAAQSATRHSISSRASLRTRWSRSPARAGLCTPRSAGPRTSSGCCRRRLSTR